MVVKQFIENWGIIVFIIGSLVALGKLLQMVKATQEWIVKADVQINPKDPENRLVTVGMCDKCRADCERHNTVIMGDIKAMLVDGYNKRDELVTALGDVSCRLGRIEGKLEK